jgi:hypothetical protein
LLPGESYNTGDGIPNEEFSDMNGPFIKIYW